MIEIFNFLVTASSDTTIEVFITIITITVPNHCVIEPTKILSDVEL